MSQVNLIGCPICSPEVADRSGIRRTIAVTASELFAFVKHVIEAHAPTIADEVDDSDDTTDRWPR